MSTSAEQFTFARASIQSLLIERAMATPGATAIRGLLRDPLTFERLLAEVEHTRKSLRSFGVGRNDRVAIILPNGPEAAVCCFAVACAATSAPLNPAYSATEFEFYLSDLQPEALIIDSCLDSPAISVAESRGIQVLRLETHHKEPAGVFQLTGTPASQPAADEESQPSHVALVLHTSGSTSRPKLVPLTQANLSISARNIAQSLALSSGDRCLNVMPLFHIHGLIGCVLSSLSAGAEVVCTPGFQAPSFFEWLAVFDPTWYSAVPTMHQSILAQFGLARASQHAETIRRSRLRFVRSASSALPPKIWEETERAFGVPMVEAYGMTEASHQMAINPLTGKRKPGSVGCAAGCEIAILGPQGALLPPETVGEIAIRGANVTAGYENNPEANRTSYVDGWFLTGDRGRFDDDGYLFLTGRSKEIINRGGEKIAPREIDEALLEHPAVAAAMTFAFPDSRLGEDVAAAVVLHENSSASEMELREHAARRLADFKVPRRIVFLDELPKGPTGKPQRIGLAERLGLSNMAAAIEAEDRSYTAPRTETERALASIWQQVLVDGPVGIHDDFFKTGGDSILGAQIVARIRQDFQVELPLFRLFGSPTIAALAEWLETAPRETGTTEGPIPRIPRDGPLPLSFSQQRMWFLTQFEENNPAYVIPNALRLRGPLRAELLEASLRSVVERHEVLRTTFAIRDGLPVLCIGSDARLDVPLLDCPDIPEDERDAMAGRLARVEAQPSFEFSRDLPIRARLVRFAADDHLLLITVHHIASDGWSKSVLFRELEHFYAAALNHREPDLPPMPIQYVDFADWLRTHMEGEHGESLMAYWKDRLAGAPSLLELPTDRPRPARQTFEGGLERLEISVDLAGAIRSLGRTESTTLYMTLLAAFQILLARYSGATDICVGTPIAHRLRPETEPLVGYFVNTLVMRTSLSGDPTFRELLSRVRETALGAYDHQDLPLDMLIEALQPARSLSYGPVFQVLFQLRNFPEIVTRLEGLDVSAVVYDPGTAQFDLSLDITEVEDGLLCVLNYNRALFDASTARSMLGHFQVLLEGIVHNPDEHVSQLPLLTDAEQQELVVVRNRTAVVYPRIPAVRLFEDQVARTPDAIAASDGSRRWTYAELNSHAAAVSHRLRLSGVTRGDLVAICVNRSVEMLGALLGIWKAGAAYVPLDPGYPPERLAYILEDSVASAVLTESNLRGCFDARIPLVLLEDCRDQVGEPNFQSEASCDDLAYVLYTSGSTGKPKGVAIRHRSVTNLLLAMQRRLEFSERETQLAITTISFDISVAELFVPLISGARVVIASREVATDANRLAGAIDESGATIVQATPSAWQMLFDAGWTGRSIKMMCTGEACPELLAQRLAATGRAWNGYGPTETTVWSTVAELCSGAPVTIGTPVANTRVYMLDANLQPTPAFVPGELYIGGVGVAAGYWRRQDLTEERFVPDPFGETGERMYRTGDLVRWLPGGELQFLGRIDTQVKLRGFRIELDEIESVLREHPAVRGAAARLIEADPGDMRLAAFYTSQPGSDISDGKLREFLRAKLPDYMVPGFLIALSEFPLTPNGKIDRAALCLPVQSDRTASISNHSSQDMTEVTLLAIWQQVLRGGAIGVDDDFFALGGHSLLGARLLARVERAFGVKLTLSAFFEAPTVAQMAALIRAKPSSGESHVFPIRAGDQPPFYILHADPVFRPLALAMPDGRAISGVSLPAAADVPQTLEQIASHEVDVLLEAQPEGPFAIGGWCVDGVLALEISHQIRARRGGAPLLVMFDSFNPAHLRRAGIWKSATMKSAAAAHRLGYHAAKVSRLSPGAAATYVQDAWRWRRKRRTLISPPKDTTPVSPIQFAASRYEPGPYDGPALLFRALDRPGGTWKDSAAGWKHLIPRLEVVDVPGNHLEMLNEPGVHIMAGRIASKIDECSFR